MPSATTTILFIRFVRQFLLVKLCGQLNSRNFRFLFRSTRIRLVLFRFHSGDVSREECSLRRWVPDS